MTIDDWDQLGSRRGSACRQLRQRCKIHGTIFEHIYMYSSYQVLNPSGAAMYVCCGRCLHLMSCV